ncbi:hypothetical protein [Metapseudomonas otitidis]|uniref:hypothetical protein n=1 Tax=Metapseudomonas otitidis TaxID=319939 RepID=UPI00209AC569|nr:hypothetical protein [Pseudomonas otitidis]MCO7557043.1 hypothetical protein [Pseudomonas otitidis]
MSEFVRRATEYLSYGEALNDGTSGKEVPVINLDQWALHIKQDASYIWRIVMEIIQPLVASNLAVVSNESTSSIIAEGSNSIPVGVVITTIHVGRRKIVISPAKNMSQNLQITVLGHVPETGFEIVRDEHGWGLIRGFWRYAFDETKLDELLSQAMFD